MKAYQFWILILASVVIAILMIKQIFLARELNQQQRQLTECQQTVSEGANFDNAWKQLAARIYQNAPQDPDMIALLKKEGVQVHVQTPNVAHPAASAAPSAVPAPAPVPSGAPQPATP